MAVALLFSSAFLLTAAVIFAVWFGFTEPWWRHPFGQSVMVLTLGIIVLSGLGLVRTIFGADYPLRDELVLVGRFLVAIGIIQRLAVLGRAQHADRR
ncbi:hypothetical protein [Nocardioides sp. Arc9.136]|uniref:putative phage holin n=1 Tax=Nocardioides sp. Arc9.136 TaxID=2996826 RepID=UPI002665F8A4|nr:hypothetical protein [Nocardioides sp. Arc9.136]WKN47161.1 hypothetical protein OSR43_14045 [Nocardioides sp. Arc9.136]